MNETHDLLRQEIPLGEILANADRRATPPLAEPRPACPTHRTRDLMTQALDGSLKQNLEYIDHLIEKLGAMKLRMVHEAGLVSAAIANHYAFAAESLAFADMVQERLATIAKNGANGHDRQDEEAEPETATGDGYSGRHGDER